MGACREGEVKGFLGTNETASSSIFLLFCDSVWGTLTKLLISLKNLVLMNFGLKGKWSYSKLPVE
jgi:hypothetical protein